MDEQVQRPPRHRRRISATRWPHGNSSCTTSRWSTSRATASTGFEALLRWRPSEAGHDLARRVHPGRRGDRPDHADRRMGAAQRLRRARALAGRRQGRGQPVAGPVPQRQPGRARAIEPRSPHSGLPPERLELEITEIGAAQRRPTSTSRDAATRCASSACASRWTISAPATRSLSYLRSFPFDKIKIDSVLRARTGAARTARRSCAAVAGLGNEPRRRDDRRRRRDRRSSSTRIRMRRLHRGAGLPVLGRRGRRARSTR